MCRTGCCGVLWASRSCWICRWMATGAQLLSRGSVRIYWMDESEIELTKQANGGFKSPVFFPDESGVMIVGFRRVAWRVLGEIVLPAFVKRRWYVCHESVQSPTDVPA